MQHFIRDYLASLEIRLDVNGLALIDTLVNRHIAQYAFSSANVILQKPLSLAPEALFERVVVKKQGGYCFEHNKILYLALGELGFNVSPLIGRVMLNGDPKNGRLHRLTLLNFDGQDYIIDVGFGVNNPRRILPLIAGEYESFAMRYQVQVGKHDFRVIQKGAFGELTLYRFDFAEMTEFDCDIAHHYSSTHQQAAFVNHLVASRVTQSERYLVRNLTMTYYNDVEGIEREQIISNPMQLHRILNQDLSLSITELEACILFQHQRKYLAAA